MLASFVLASNVKTEKVPAEGPRWWIGDPLRRDPVGLTSRPQTLPDRQCGIHRQTRPNANNAKFRCIANFAV